MKKDNIRTALQLAKLLNFDRKMMRGPVRFDVAVTSACNFNCVFCGAHSKYIPNVEPEHLTERALSGIFRSMEALKTKEILFAGNGEPLLHPDLPRYIKTYGNDYRIDIVTNGSLLERITERTFNKLFRITVSLNSGNGISHQVTHGYKGENRFNHIVKQIERLIGYRRGKNKVHLYYVITADNTGELDDFKRMATAWGVEYHARPVDILVPDMNTLASAPPKDMTLIDCLLPYVQGSISAGGNVLVCCGAGKSLGNLQFNNLAGIWRSRLSVQTRRQVASMGRTGKPVYPCCAGCANAKVFDKFTQIYRHIPFVKRIGT
jgi:MoaA/NifB/PqqE/SkfB family radical SAM enzyme